MSENDSRPETRRRQERWQLKEIPFTSSVPVVGPIIIAIRNLWNSVAAKWYVRPIIEQQNDYNRLFAELVDHLNNQQVEEDREISDISHDLAELEAMIGTIHRSLHSLDERLSELEKRLAEE